MIRFTIPATPPSKLSLNSRVNHWERTRLKRDLQFATRKGWESRDVGIVDPGASQGLTGASRLWIDIAVFWEKGHRIVDEDNLIASCKGMIDMVAKLLDVNDKTFRIGEVTQGRDQAKDGYTIVTIREVE